MAVNLLGRSLLTLIDYTPEEIGYLLNLSAKVKKQRQAGEQHRRFEGKTLALLFEKRSTRTRCAFETAFGEENGHPVFLSSSDIHLGVKETVEDTARVLGRMFDAIQFRGFSQDVVATLAAHAGIPVYNGLTDLYHPTQILADLLTVIEEFGELRGKTLTYVGDGRNNMARSLMIGCAKTGANFTIVTPDSLVPDEKSVALSKEYAAASGSTIKVTSSVEEGIPGSDVVYTDVWVSMGEESKSQERLALLKPYQVNASLMERTGKKDAIFMHCLPAVRENEVTSEVMDGAQSRVWDEAENRKHTIKAVMLATLLPPEEL